jgi:hypothetical protein
LDHDDSWLYPPAATHIAQMSPEPDERKQLWPVVAKMLGLNYIEKTQARSVGASKAASSARHKSRRTSSARPR